MDAASRSLASARGGSGQVAARTGASPDDRLFTSRDVSRIAQVSLRQLQWWDEHRLVSPRQKEHRRVYVPEEVIEILVAAELRRKGLSLQKLRSAFRFLRHEKGRRLSKRLSSKRDLYLLTDGKSVHLEEGQEHVIELLKKARQPMLLVCVSDLVKRLASEKGSRRSDSQLKLF